MECENCKTTENQIKYGKTKAGSQKYKCKVCGKVYTPNPKTRSYDENIKKQAVKLYMEGNSGRAVGRILGIGKNVCLDWIKKHAKSIKPKNKANERIEVIEMDELYSFVKKNKKFYIMTLVDRYTRQIAGFDVAFDRNIIRIQNLVDNSPKAKQYYSDSFSVYSEICYSGQHTSLKNKSQTYTVESVNSDFRHYIAPLKRKSKCFLDPFRQLKLYAVFLSMLSIN